MSLYELSKEGLFRSMPASGYLCLSCLVSFRVSSFLRPLDLAPLNVAEVVAHEVALLYLLSDMGTGHLVSWGQPPGNASQPWSCLLKYEIRIV